jgi:hypothetical protein
VIRSIKAANNAFHRYTLVVADSMDVAGGAQAETRCSETLLNRSPHPLDQYAHLIHNVSVLPATQLTHSLVRRYLTWYEDQGILQGADRSAG